jgi:hypothetical protein
MVVVENPPHRMNVVAAAAQPQLVGQERVQLQEAAAQAQRHLFRVAASLMLAAAAGGCRAEPLEPAALVVAVTALQTAALLQVERLISEVLVEVEVLLHQTLVQAAQAALAS